MSWLLGIALCLGLALSCLPTTAFADRAEAKARDSFNQGVTAFEQGRLAEALELFRKAYKLKPSYRILYNIAQTEAELGRPHKAIATFEAYLAEGGAEVPKKRRLATERELRKLAALVGTLDINGPPGAKLWVDGDHIGSLPLGAPISLPAGQHRILVQLPGFEPCEKTVEVRGQEATSEQCEPTPPEVPEPQHPSPSVTLTTTTTPAPKERVLFDSVAPWTATGLSAACLAVGIVLMAKTQSLNSELRGACPQGICPASRAGDVETLPKLAAGADALLVATAVLSAAATALFLAPWKKKSKRLDHHPKGAP
jgi:hypothetical protein